ILLTLFALLSPPPPRSTLFPYTTLFRSILADIEGVPPGKTERMQHAIGAGHVLLLVAEQREVGTGLRSKALVLAQRVDAGHEIGDVILADQMTIFRQRLALYGAAGGIGSGKPGQYHRLLATVVRQPMNLAIRTRQFEIRCRIAHFQCL